MLCLQLQISSKKGAKTGTKEAKSPSKKQPKKTKGIIKPARGKRGHKRPRSDLRIQKRLVSLPLLTYTIYTESHRVADSVAFFARCKSPCSARKVCGTALLTSTSRRLERTSANRYVCICLCMSVYVCVC